MLFRSGLRTVWGIDLEALKARFGDELHDYFLQNAQRYFNLNYLKRDNAIVTLTHAGIFISDGIMSDLMKV